MRKFHQIYCFLVATVNDGSRAICYPPKGTLFNSAIPPYIKMKLTTYLHGFNNNLKFNNVASTLAQMTHL